MRDVDILKNFDQVTMFWKKAFEAEECQRRTDFSERKISTAYISQAFRIRASNRRETDGSKFVADSSVDWEPVECTQDIGYVVQTWWPEDYSGCVVSDDLWEDTYGNWPEEKYGKQTVSKQKNAKTFSLH